MHGRWQATDIQSPAYVVHRSTYSSYVARLANRKVRGNAKTETNA
jgi:hypothetical protein